MGLGNTVSAIVSIASIVVAIMFTSCNNGEQVAQGHDASTVDVKSGDAKSGDAKSGGATSTAVHAEQADQESSPSSDKKGMPGSQEFGLTKKELVRRIEAVEKRIAECMREQGFEYIASDFRTVRQGMSADKTLPGVSEEDFIAEYGFGVATMYTGNAPQLADGYSPGRVGLGERNVQIFRDLSAVDQDAYNQALLGDNADATFAVGLETENFFQCGGCTLKAIEQVFEPEELTESYYNPLDAMINKDPRMKAAIRRYATAIRDKGYNYDHPDEVETDVRKRLAVITAGGTIPVDELTPDALQALKDLQDYERRVADLHYHLAVDIIDPVEEEIEEEMFARRVQ